jgi:quercetin dioxygenase-like cupin family protein
VIHCLRGDLSVEAGREQHQLRSGEVLVLEPDVPHSVEAVAESEMMLTVCIG